jgi:hypothetical protein
LFEFLQMLFRGLLLLFEKLDVLLKVLDLFLLAGSLRPPRTWRTVRNTSPVLAMGPKKSPA